ncbi:U-megalopygitoxin(8)-Mc8-like [Epargyreus clarus]|uniref:U-megalopygitoxin(8)-Mc8-like n=1 Tax=Epargyreus clarus TaxID=520877 RepID=UPI003C2BF80F
MYSVSMNILLLLLPALVGGTIHIEIVPATESRNVSVRWSGSETRPITVKDQEAFKLTENGVGYQLVIHGYKAPTYVHVRNAGQYGYRDMMVTLTPTGATIKRHTKRSVIVTVKEFSNNFSTPAVFKGGIKEDVVETMSSTWSKSEELSIGRTIVLKFGTRQISHTSSRMEEVHKSITKTISTSSDVEMTLQPWQKAKAILKATRALLEVEVDYEVTVEGDIHCYYTFFWIPIQSQGFDIQDYFRLIKKPNCIKSKEVISVDYYYGAQVDVTDGDQKVPFELV